MFLFYMEILFSLNAIFYTDSSISKRYHNDGNLLVIENMKRILFSYCISLILHKFVGLFNYYAPIFDAFVIEIKDNTTLGEYFNKSIHIVKRKIIILYFVIISFSIYFLYYLTLFCIVYNSIQMSWFASAWISLSLSFFLAAVYALIFSICKIIALRCKSRVLYNLLLYMYLHIS